VPVWTLGDNNSGYIPVALAELQRQQQHGVVPLMREQAHIFKVKELNESHVNSNQDFEFIQSNALWLPLRCHCGF
jgi:hypothetical protein